MNTTTKNTNKTNYPNTTQTEKSISAGLYNDINRLDLAQNVFLPLVLEDIAEVLRAATSFVVQQQEVILEHKEKIKEQEQRIIAQKSRINKQEEEYNKLKVKLQTLEEDYTDLNIEFQSLEDRVFDYNNAILELKQNYASTAKQIVLDKRASDSQFRNHLSSNEDAAFRVPNKFTKGV